MSSEKLADVPEPESNAIADDVVVSARNLGKMYHLYDRPQDRLKQAFLWGKKQLFREFWALRDVSFEVRRGEALGIIGRNGAGKSTLLQILAGTLAPTTGEVQVKGRVAALLELGSGFNPEFTGRENVYLNGAILGFSRQEMDARLDEIVAFADIGQFIDQPVKLYSSGMFVRLAFAVQACVDPDVLIVDEALSVGDIFFQQKCFKRLNDLINRGTSIILVTHDVTAVGQFCSTVMVLNEGGSVFLGDPANGVRKYLALQRHESFLLFKQPKNLLNDAGSSPDYELTADFWWPPSEAFLSLAGTLPEGIGWARCTGIAICDEHNMPRTLFKIGERAVFYYEFLVLEDIRVPIGGVTIVNDKNIFVHGKNSLQHELKPVPSVAKGSLVRFRQSVVLDIAAGNYTFIVGLATLSLTDYENADNMTGEILSGKIIRILSVGQAGSFSVITRTEGQALPHHGLCNLPGDCAMTTVRDAA